jgi:hypothetical protein
VVPKTAIRALSSWQREALIHTHDQVIVIRNVAALRQHAGCNDCLYDCSVFDSPPPVVT